MPVYYFVPFIVGNCYLLFQVSNGHNSVTVQNRTHVYMNFFITKTYEITSCTYALKSWNILYIYTSYCFWMGSKAHVLKLCVILVILCISGCYILLTHMQVWLESYSHVCSQDDSYSCITNFSLSIVASTSASVISKYVTSRTEFFVTGHILIIAVFLPSLADSSAVTCNSDH